MGWGGSRPLRVLLIDSPHGNLGTRGLQVVPSLRPLIWCEAAPGPSRLATQCELMVLRELI